MLTQEILRQSLLKLTMLGIFLVVLLHLFRWEGHRVVWLPDPRLQSAWKVGQWWFRLGGTILKMIQLGRELYRLVGN